MAMPESITKCFFLDALPLELRINVYEYLVVADSPLHGKTALKRKNKKYNLDLAILWTNHQIYDEAKSVFYRKNTFSVTSTSVTRLEKGKAPASSSSEGSQVTPVFDPPLHPSIWPLLRHLTIDLMYDPSKSTPKYVSHIKNIAWAPFNREYAQYISTLTRLLTTTSTTLLSLSLSINLTRTLRPVVNPETIIGREIVGPFSIFCHSRTSDRFTTALATLRPEIQKIPLLVEFKYGWFKTEVDKELFRVRRIWLGVSVALDNLEMGVRVEALFQSLSTSCADFGARIRAIDDDGCKGINFSDKLKGVWDDTMSELDSWERIPCEGPTTAEV